MPEHLEGPHPAQFASWSMAADLGCYRTMLHIRRFEEKVAQLYAMGQIAALSPLSIGQEAVAAGVAFAAQPADAVIAGPRPHGVMLARGVAPGQLMAVLMAHGRVQNAAGGSSPRNRALGADLQARTVHLPLPRASDILELAAACAPGQAVIWCVGDGVADAEALIDAIVRASTAALPVVVVIENVSTHIPGLDSCSASASLLVQHCRQAGLKTAAVNGLDVRHVSAAAGQALATGKSGGGVTVLEIMTYRYQGHAREPGFLTRTGPSRDDSDPVAKIRARIAAAGGPVTGARLKDIEHAVRAEAGDALRFARENFSTL